MIVNGAGKKIFYRTIPTDRHIANNDPVGSSLKLFLLERNCFITNSTVMLNKKALLNIGGFLEAGGLAHDFTTWTRLSLEGRFVGNPLCLGYWRRHLSSTNYGRSPEVLMNSGLDFLREFVVLNKQKLTDLGFSYDRDILETHWRKLNPYSHYYNRAVIALSARSFREAKAASKNILGSDASLTQRLIYFLVILSSFVQYDLVNPLSVFKAKVEKIIHDHLGPLIRRKTER